MEIRTCFRLSLGKYSFQFGSQLNLKGVVMMVVVVLVVVVVVVVVLVVVMVVVVVGEALFN